MTRIKKAIHHPGLEDDIAKFLSGKDPESEPLEFNPRHVTVNVKVYDIGNGWTGIHISEIVDTETGEVLQDYDK